MSTVIISKVAKSLKYLSDGLQTLLASHADVNAKMPKMFPRILTTQHLNLHKCWLPLAGPGWSWLVLAGPLLALTGPGRAWVALIYTWRALP
jgi:hypothetical protein